MKIVGQWEGIAMYDNEMTMNLTAQLQDLKDAANRLTEQDKNAVRKAVCELLDITQQSA